MKGNIVLFAALCAACLSCQKADSGSKNHPHADGVSANGLRTERSGKDNLSAQRGASAQAKGKAHTQLDDLLETPAGLTDRPEEIVRHKAYTVSYNARSKSPNWVAWQLTAEHTRGNVPRAPFFLPDPDLRESKSADDYDYRRSGYDRGHMCPAGDNKWDKQAMQETFYFSNVCPQLRALNEGDWNMLEEKCRKWARKYRKIYIACGPVAGTSTRVVGRNRVAVPEAFYKVVLRADGDTYKAIGFIFPNGRQNRELQYYAMSVDDVEAKTGINFFNKLPGAAERRAEASYRWDDWK